MRAITARGTSREIGRVLGEEARRAVRNRVFESQAYADLRPWQGSARLAAIMAASRAVCPAYLEEIAGIAEGVCVPLEDTFLWNCRGDLPPPGSAPEGCTTVMRPPDRGRPGIVAHNEDGGANLAGSGFMARIEPEAGPGFTSFCYPGMLPGHSFAMNDAGLVQTINNISPHDLTTGIARHFVCRAILACRSLQEALVWLIQILILETHLMGRIRPSGRKAVQRDAQASGKQPDALRRADTPHRRPRQAAAPRGASPSRAATPTT